MKNGATNGRRATHDRERGHGAYDVRTYEVSVVDGLDDDSGWGDACIGHKRSDFRRRNGDDIDYYTTEVWLLFSALALIADLICENIEHLCKWSHYQVATNYII